MPLDRTGICYLLLIATCFSCGTSKKARPLPVAEVSPTVPPALPSPAVIDNPSPEIPDTIVFITMRITYDSTKQKSGITVLNTILKPGHLKKETTNVQGPYFLKCMLFGGSANEMRTLKIEHPLHKQVEWINDNKQPESRLVHLHDAEFFVRFQKKGDNEMIIFENTTTIPNKEIKRISF